MSVKLQEIAELEAKSEQCYKELGDAQEAHNQVKIKILYLNIKKKNYFHFFFFD
jgi:hypothetical protein